MFEKFSENLLKFYLTNLFSLIKVRILSFTVGISKEAFCMIFVDGVELRKAPDKGRILRLSAYGDFSGVVLKNKNFSGFQLQGSLLEGVHFTDIQLKGANLEGVILENGYFRNVSFRGSLLKNASLKNSTFIGCSFEKADLTGVDCEGAHFERCIFSKANVCFASFQGARLERCNFKKADLYGSNLENAFLRRVKFKKTGLRQVEAGGVCLEKTDLTLEGGIWYEEDERRELAGERARRWRRVRRRLMIFGLLCGLIGLGWFYLFSPPSLFSRLESARERYLAYQKYLKGQWQKLDFQEGYVRRRMRSYLRRDYIQKGRSVPGFMEAVKDSLLKSYLDQLAVLAAGKEELERRQREVELVLSELERYRLAAFVSDASSAAPSEKEVGTLLEGLKLDLHRSPWDTPSRFNVPKGVVDTLQGCQKAKEIYLREREEVRAEGG
ncbi:MAG: pentapeptide repeat-containing protein [Planctomycetota bacterium]|nr:MAG: pentapeptide repeat-containing protein [Planctomycetota bacterium]